MKERLGGGFRIAVLLLASIPLVTSALVLSVILLASQCGASNGFTDDFSSDSGRWTYRGIAHRDLINEYVVLTSLTANSWGHIWFDEDIGVPLRVGFRYRAGGGTGADGFVLMFYKKTDYEPDWGGYLGFCALPRDSQTPVPGYGVEFDNYHNAKPADPSPRHIALIKDEPGNHLVSTNDPRVEDFQWHSVEVNIGESTITVLVDGDEVLAWSGTIDRTFEGFGFSGSTGASTNWHVIDDVSINRVSVMDLKQDVIAELDTLNPQSKHVAKGIKKAKKHIEKSLESKRWLDETHLHPKHGKKVFYEEKKAVKDIRKLCKKGDFPDELCERLIGMLVEADSILARVAIDDAIAANGNPKEIEKAEKEMAKAEKDKEKGKYDKAIDHYKKAWQHAIKAVKHHKPNQM